MGAFLDSLEQYVKLGFAVFPVIGKRPTTRNGFKDAVRNVEAAKDLFGRYIGDGVAVATGMVSGGLLVIDVDDRKGGDTSLVALEQEIGHKLPDSVRALTPSGGQHIYLRIPVGTEIPSSVDFRPGIDIRCDGGYVVAPPSPRYQWDLSCDPADNSIADAPYFLIELLLERHRKKAAGGGAGWESGGFTLPQVIGEGGRDNTLTQFAGQLRRGGLDTEMIFDLLQHANETRCQPPLENADLKRIARSIGSKPLEPVKGEEYIASVKDDGTDIPGYTTWSQIPDVLRKYSGMESMTTGFPILDKRIGGGLFTTQTAILVAPTGSGKTAFALQIARTAAQRRPVVFWTMEMPTPFLVARYAAQEVGEYYLDIVNDVDLHPPTHRAIPKRFSFYGGRKLDDLVRCVRRAHEDGGGEIAPLLVVDYLQKIPSQSEEARQRIMEASESLRALALSLSCPVLCISSASRSGVALLRRPLDHDPEELVGLGKDAGEIEYDANTVITIGLEATKVDDDEPPEWRDAVVTVAKGRFGPGEAHLAYRFNGRAGVWEENGYASKEAKNLTGAQKQVMDELARLPGGVAPSKRFLLDRIKLNRNTTLAAINALVEAGAVNVNERNQVIASRGETQ